MNEELTYDLIERYLNKALTSAEKTTVEDRLKNDPEFLEQVTAHRTANSIIIDNALLDIKKELKKIHANGRAKTNYRKFYYGFGALLTGAVVITALLLLDDTKTEKPINIADQKILIKDSSSYKSAVKNELPQEQKLLSKNEDKHDDGNAIKTQDTAILKFLEKNNFETKVDPEKDKKISNGQNSTTQNSPLNNKINTNENPENNIKTLTSIGEAKQDISPCDMIITKPDFSIINSCEGQKNGAIIFNEQTLQGMPPFKFSIDGGNTFNSSNQFNNQAAGNYLLMVMDRKNCKSEPVEAQVEKDNCNYIIFPQQQKYWEVSLERFEGEQVALKIRNARNSEIVYQTSITAVSSYVWQGVDQNNNPLTMGNYVYELSSGKFSHVQTGQITIVK